MGDGGFEPPKASLTDLQSAPFGHSGNLPNKYLLYSHCRLSQTAFAQSIASQYKKIFVLHPTQASLYG